MIDIYAIIATLSTTIRDSTDVRDYCITNCGRGCLVQIDDIADNPLDETTTPWIIIAKNEPGELGGTAATSNMSIRLVCGVSVPAVTFKDTTARTATSNGLRELEAGKVAEGLMRLAVAACKGVALGSGMLLEAANPDVDVYTFAPLQMASCVILATKTQDMSTF